MTIKIYTTTWCGDCLMTKAWLDERGIAYEEINIERSPEAAEFVKSVNQGKRKVPTLVAGEDIFHNSPFSGVVLNEHLGRK